MEKKQMPPPSSEPRAGPSGINKPSTSSAGQRMSDLPQSQNAEQQAKGNVPTAGYKINVTVLSSVPIDLGNDIQGWTDPTVIGSFDVEGAELIPLSRIEAIAQELEEYKAQPSGSMIYIVVKEDKNKETTYSSSFIVSHEKGTDVSEYFNKYEGDNTTK